MRTNYNTTALLCLTEPHNCRLSVTAITPNISDVTFVIVVSMIAVVSMVEAVAKAVTVPKIDIANARITVKAVLLVKMIITTH